MSDQETPDRAMAASDDTWIVSGFLWAVLSDDNRGLRRFMKVTNIEAEQQDQRRLLITFISGARVRIVVEGLE